MQFGLSISFEDWSHLRDLGQTAEELGFNSLFFPDHLLFEGAERDGKPRHPALDPIIQAAVVADATRRVRIGHLVLCNPFRHPGVTARFFSALADAGVNIEMISTSEIRISVVVDQNDVDVAVSAAHAAFDLGDGSEQAVVYGGTGR